MCNNSPRTSSSRTTVTQHGCEQSNKYLPVKYCQSVVSIHKNINGQHNENVITGQVSRFEFELGLTSQHIIGHFGDESSQAINYTGTGNKKVTN